MTKPTIPQGTRDFGPDVVRKRQYILNTIREVFELYGFQPLETPAMENLETLMGKYGDEGDKLIFKILNNGLEEPKKEETARTAFENVLKGKNDKQLTERALKYDLTIPFARYVAMNQNSLVFPFKRYQIQPVWRADKPQRGRYREFYQCDADIVGSSSLLNEVELASIYVTVFSKLKLNDAAIHINSRKILSALAEVAGGHEKFMDITVAIDKLDKIGIEKVKQELSGREIGEQQVNKIEKYLSISGSNQEKLAQLESLLGSSESGKKGIADLKYILEHLSGYGELIKIDFSLARGLNYYTGVIFEAKAPPSVKIGSIGGGGRYDDLTGLFGVPGIPGVGISFGVDRIYDVLEELKLFPEAVEVGTKVLFLNFGEAESAEAFRQMQLLRERGISSELFHEPAKLDKQFKYAERKNIRYAVFIGSEEIKNKSCRVKDLQSREQFDMSFEELRGFKF